MGVWIEIKKNVRKAPMNEILTINELVPFNPPTYGAFQCIGGLVRMGYLMRHSKYHYIKVKEMSVEFSLKGSDRDNCSLKKFKRESAETAKVHKVFDTIGLSHLKWLLSDVY